MQNKVVRSVSSRSLIFVLTFLSGCLFFYSFVVSAQSPQPYVDLKVDGSDGPLQVSTEIRPRITWDSNGVTSCESYGTFAYISDGSIWDDRLKLSPRGEALLAVDKVAHLIPTGIKIGISCKTITGSSVGDRVDVAVLGPVTKPSYLTSAQSTIISLASFTVMGFLFFWLGLLAIRKLLLPILDRKELFRERIFMYSLIFTVVLFTLFSLPLILLFLWSEQYDFAAQTTFKDFVFSFSLATFWALIVTYFLVFIVANLKWILKFPKFHSRAGLFFTLFAWWTAVFFSGLVMLGASFAKYGGEGYNYLMLGIISATPIVILIFAALGALLKNFVSLPLVYTQTTSQPSEQTTFANGKKLENFLFRPIERLSGFLRLGIWLSILSVMISLVRVALFTLLREGSRDLIDILTLISPSSWFQALTRSFRISDVFLGNVEAFIGTRIPFVEIFATTFLAVIFWRRFLVIRFIGSEKRGLALFIAVLVYLLIVAVVFGFSSLGLNWLGS